MKILNRYVLIFIFIFLILSGLNSFLSIAHAESSYNWNTTTGTIVTAKNVPNANGNDNLELNYTYSVNNKTYSSQNEIVPVSIVIFLFTGGNYVDASQFALHHPAGSSIQVYYNPQDPSDATLENGFTLFQYFDMLYLIILSFSLIISIFTYKKNPRFPNVTGIPERIIITQFLNVAVMVLSGLYFFSFLFVDFISLFFIIASEYVGLTILVIPIRTVQQTLNLPIELYQLSLLFIFLVCLIILIKFIVKGFQSLIIKGNKNYTYYTEDYEIKINTPYNDWFIEIKGFYTNFKEEKDFIYIVPEKFQSESEAENFYNKKIKQDYGSKEKQFRNLFAHNTLYFVKNKGLDEEQILLSYQYYSFVKLFLGLSFFIAFDYLVFLLIGFQYVTFNSLIQNIFLNSVFRMNHMYVFTDSLFLSVVMILGIIELSYLVFLLVKGFEIFYQKVYKNILWPEDEIPNSRKSTRFKTSGIVYLIKMYR